MNSIVESPEIRDSLAPMSVEFYHAATEMGWIGEDVELLEGFTVKKRSKSPEHEYWVEVLKRMLERLLPPTHFVAKERPLTCLNSEPEPDLMVVEGDALSFRAAHPSTAELVVEVAIHTVEKDRRKAAIYAGAGVKEYWVFDPSAASVTVFRRPSDGAYEEVTTHSAKARLESEVIPGFVVELPGFFG